MLTSKIKNLIKQGEGYICKIIVPLSSDAAMQDTVQATMQDTAQATMQAAAQDTAQAVMQDERVLKILEFCRTPRKREETQALIGVCHREYFRKEILTPLLEQGLLHPAAPGKLTSPKQRYYSGAQQDEKGVGNNSIEFDGIGKLTGGKNPEGKQ